MTKPVAPAKVKFGYTQVTATGLGKTVSATCPTGYKVTGGGSRSETTGSYPSSNTSWTVVRDHLSPKRLDVTAVCVRVASLQLILNLIASAFHHHGAVHASVGAVSDHLGWVEHEALDRPRVPAWHEGCGF
jgi:hypothetical protein